MTTRSLSLSFRTLIAPLIVVFTISSVLLFKSKAQTRITSQTEVITAVQARNIPHLSSLLQRGANPNAVEQSADGISREMTALMIAADHHDIACIKTLLQHHADVNATDKYRWTALIFAAGSEESPKVENAASVRLLLDSKADINAVTVDGVTPLIRAASNGSEQTVRLLLTRGADTGRKDKRNRTALILAIQKKRPNIIAALRQAGVQHQ